MGYRRVPTIFTLDSIPEEDGLVVRMSSIRLGKLRRLMALTSDAAVGDDEDKATEEILELFAENLVSWNLEDFETGNPIAPNMAGIDQQEVQFIMAIVGAWMEAMTGTEGPADLGKGSTDGEKFPGRPLTMEAL